MNIYNKILQEGYYPEDLKLGMTSDAAKHFKSTDSLPEKDMYETYIKFNGNLAYASSSLKTVFMDSKDREAYKLELDDIKRNIKMALALMYESDGEELNLALALINEAKEGVTAYCKHQPLLARKIKEQTMVKYLDTIVEDAALAYIQTNLLDLTN